MKQKIEKANNKRRVEILLLNYANNAISFKSAQIYSILFTNNKIDFFIILLIFPYIARNLYIYIYIKINYMSIYFYT